MLIEIAVKTETRCQMIDITAKVAEAVAKSGVKEGICVVYVPHTTAGVSVNENADPDVKGDILSHLAELVPQKGGFRHMEGNSDAHIKGLATGFSQTFIITRGALLLGTWQGIYLCEYDGPRHRKAYVKILAG